MKNQQTQIKETAYALAKKHGWALEYEGGLELDGEYLDDADLSWNSPSGKTYVLNISWAESTAYGFTLTSQESEGQKQEGASFGIFTGQDLGGTPFENASFILPQQGQTLAEKYYITSLVDLLEYIEEAVKNI